MSRHSAVPETRRAPSRLARRISQLLGSGTTSQSQHRVRSRRKPHLLVAALLLAVVGSGLTAAPASAAVANSTFEGGTSGWFATPSSGTTLARVAGGHGSAYAGRVTNNGGSAVTAVLNDDANSIASTTAGATYRATAWVRAVQPGTSLVLRTMEFAGSSLVEHRQTNVWATDTSWHQLTVDLTAKRAGSSIDLNVLAWGLGNSRSFDVDDVSIAATTGAPAPAPPPVARSSSAAAAMLPVQGSGALFGYYEAGAADPRPMESRIGRKFDLVHHYNDFNGAGTRWPSAEQEKQSAEGRAVHVGWELTSYNGSYDPSLQPAPAKTVWHAGRNKKIWTYAQILDGSMNRYLDTMADRVGASPHNYIVDFNHEMDDLPDVGGSNTLRAAHGSRAEYKAAYRYIIDRFRAKGVDNVVWAWTVSGWYAGDSSKAWSLHQIWPGSDYIDMIMWDPYNHNRDRWKSFGQMVDPFYRAIKGGVLDKVDTKAKTLPLGLGEYGCVADPRRTAWLRAIPDELKAYPGIVSIGYFSSGSWGSIHQDGAATAAFAEAGRNGYLKTGK